MQPILASAPRKAAPKNSVPAPATLRRSSVKADEKTRRLIDAIKGLKGLR